VALDHAHEIWRWLGGGIVLHPCCTSANEATVSLKEFGGGGWRRAVAVPEARKDEEGESAKVCRSLSAGYIS
jgi:carbamate kinase